MTPPVGLPGLAVSPPRGWEVAVYRRPSLAGESSFPVLHAATVPLPPGRGDYGSAVVERLGPGDVFVGLLDFGPDAAATALFCAEGLPRLEPAMFRPRQLQRFIPGQSGVQRFFHAAGHGLCLYAVLGSHAGRLGLCRRANDLLAGVVIGAGR